MKQTIIVRTALLAALCSVCGGTVEAQNGQGMVGETKIDKVKYFTGLAATPRSTYYRGGKGFANGDRLRFTSKSRLVRPTEQTTRLHGTDSVAVTLPDGFVTGDYAMTLVRGNLEQSLGNNRIVMVGKMPRPVGIIAHRGFWDTKGSAQNSRTGLAKALDMNVYGSETDYWITRDGHLVINHNHDIDGKVIETSTYDELKNCRLSNGETLPQLSDLIEVIKQHPNSKTRLVLETKEHSTDERNRAAVDAAVKLIREAGLLDRVSFTSFSLVALKEILRLAPKAKVVYLKGGMSPEKAHSIGIRGLSYNIKELRDNPQWVSEAHALGLTVNAWTINTVADMTEMTNLGVDYISSNNPLVAVEVEKYYAEHQ